MVNNDYDKFRSFSRLYMTVFRHRTCAYALDERHIFSFSLQWLGLLSIGFVISLSKIAPPPLPSSLFCPLSSAYACLTRRVWSVVVAVAVQGDRDALQLPDGVHVLLDARRGPLSSHDDHVGADRRTDQVLALRAHRLAWVPDTSITLWTRSIVVQFSLLWDHGAASGTG